MEPATWRDGQVASLDHETYILITLNASSRPANPARSGALMQFDEV
jgi:hypothetical protein